MNKFKKHLAALSVLSCTAALFAGCGKEDPKATISIASESEVINVQRHQSISIVPTFENAEKSEIVYTVTGAATMVEDVLTIKDDAAVGSEVAVIAKIGDVISNELKWSVVDTSPSGMALFANKSLLKEGEAVGFTATYTPTYATLTDFTIAVAEESKDLIEVAPANAKAVQLKEGISELEHLGEAVKVVATSTANASVKAEATLIIGTVEPYLTVASKSILIGRDDTSDLSIDVKAFGKDGSVISIDKTAYTYESSDPEVFTVGEHTGKITPVGHGTAEVTVSFGDLSKKANITVMVPPTDINLSGMSSVAITNGLYTGMGAKNKIASPFASSRTDSMKYSDKLVYSFKRLDDLGQPIVEESSEIGEVDSEGNIVFKKTGKVVVSATSSSALTEEDISAREITKDMIFNVNEGTNVYGQADLHWALLDGNVKHVNLIKPIEFHKINNVTDERGTYNASYRTEANNERYCGYKSIGDKIINGNGYGVTLAKAEIPEVVDEDKLIDGIEFINFLPAGVDPNAPEVYEDVNRDPYTVEIYDFYLIGNNDLQGMYKGDLAGFDELKIANKNFAKSFRRGLRIGYSNSHAERYNTNLQREYQQNCGAYINKPVLKNVEIKGFECGLRMEHVVDGYVENISCGDQYNNGIELSQCLIEIHNSSFNKVGGFCVEVVPDGIDTKNFPVVDLEEAGSNYNKLPDVKLTGFIHSENLTDGSDTDRMQSLKLGEFTITQVLNFVANDMKTQVLTELLTGEESATYIAAGLTDKTKQAQMSGLIDQILAQTFFNNPSEQKVNFFSLIFIYQYVKIGLPITGDSCAHVHADAQGASGEEGDQITLHDLIENVVTTYVKQGQAIYDGFKKFNYIKIDIDGETIRNAGECYIGQMLCVNNGYNPNYTPAQ